MKKILSTILSLCILLSCVNIPVFAASINSVQNFNKFLSEHPNGSIYKNDERDSFWKSEEPNRAFIYEFYKDVFNISLYNLKLDYNSKTVSTESQIAVEDFFDKLSPGDYIFIEGYYAIFIGKEGKIVTLYDVGLPLLGGTNKVHYSSYDINALCNFSSSIKSYSPNEQGYKINENQQDIEKDLEPYWEVPGLNADGQLYMRVGERIDISVYTYSNKERFTVTDRMKFISKNSSVATIDGKQILAMKPGTTTITGTGINVNLSHAIYMTVIVVDADQEIKDPTLEDTSPYKIDWRVGGLNENNELVLPVGAQQSLHIQNKERPQLELKDFVTYHSADQKVAVIKDKKVIAVDTGCTYIYVSSPEISFDLPKPISICVYEQENMPKKEKKLVEIKVSIAGSSADKIKINLNDKVNVVLTGIYDDNSTEDVTFKFIDSIITTNSILVSQNSASLIANKIGIFDVTIDNELANQVKTNSIQIEIVDPFTDSYVNESAEKSKFVDVTGHWAQEYIDTLADLGIVDGFDTGFFEPNAHVTLEQAVKVIVSAAPAIFNKENKKIEYWVSSWAVPYMKESLPLLHSTHYDTGFYGTNPATRAEIADMIVKALGENIIYKPTDLTYFQDYDLIEEWSTESLEKMVQTGIMQGDDLRQLKPNFSITRAEFCKMIAIAFNLI